MLNVIFKTVNVCAAIYFMIVVGGAIYEKGKEDGKKELTDISESSEDAPDSDERYVVVNGVKYEAVKI